MGPNLDAAARQGKAGGHNRFMRVACAAVFASVLAFGAGAQEFVIPGAAELAAMSVQAKIEMERQLTADAQDWPRTEFFEPLFNPDPMALVAPKVSGKLTGVDALHRGGLIENNVGPHVWQDSVDAGTTPLDLPGQCSASSYVPTLGRQNNVIRIRQARARTAALPTALRGQVAEAYWYLTLPSAARNRKPVSPRQPRNRNGKRGPTSNISVGFHARLSLGCTDVTANPSAPVVPSKSPQASLGAAALAWASIAARSAGLITIKALLR